MRTGWAQVAAVLLLVLASAEPSLVLGAVAAVLLVWAVTRGVRPAHAMAGPAAAAREHRRTLARRAVPRQRDPDAPGHTRSRAPSGLLPAV